MIERQNVNAISIMDEGFLVASLIERCPKTMMLRELFVNALEAAQGDPSGAGKVRIGARMVEGVRKLAIWNNGVGLSAPELDRICDLASSLRKITGLDNNFGMGAKVASLPSNKHGLRYRSCKDGRVSEVILCQRGGVYGRLQRRDAEGRLVNVIDVTAEGDPADRDWTEVVLFGDRPDQDTVSDPYAGNPAMPANWIEATLTARFFRLPASVEVSFEPSILGGGPARSLQSLVTRSRRNSRSETVRLPSGVVVTYRFDPPAAHELDHEAEGPGLACLVHKSEIYDFTSGRKWVLDAPLCGIPFGAKFCSVIVELPDNYPVRPEAYREYLRFLGGDQRKVGVLDFAKVVRAGLPRWLADIIAKFGPRAGDYMNDVNQELADLIRDLALKEEAAAREPAVAPPGPKLPAEAAAAKDDKPPKPPKPPAPPKLAPAPEIIALSNPDDIDDRGLVGRAGRYYEATNQLFVNLRYSAVERLKQELMREAPRDMAPESFASFAAAAAEWAILRRIARATVYGVSKKEEGWPSDAVQRALTPEALSLAADDFADMREQVRERLRAMMAGQGELGQAA